MKTYIMINDILWHYFAFLFSYVHTRAHTHRRTHIAHKYKRTNVAQGNISKAGACRPKTSEATIASFLEEGAHARRLMARWNKETSFQWPYDPNFKQPIGAITPEFSRLLRSKLKPSVQLPPPPKSPEKKHLADVFQRKPNHLSQCNGALGVFVAAFPRVQTHAPTFPVRPVGVMDISGMHGVRFRGEGFQRERDGHHLSGLAGCVDLREVVACGWSQDLHGACNDAFCIAGEGGKMRKRKGGTEMGAHERP